MREEALQSFVDASVDDLAALDRDERVATQNESLFFGTAGTAYACWRVGRRLGLPVLEAAARRLIAGAEGAGEPSLFYGPAGVAWVRALVLGGGAVEAFVDEVPAAAPPPLLDGMAGWLVAVAGLARVRGSAAAGALADRLAAALGATEPSLAAAGVAHGRAGVILALLVAGRPLPSWIWDALAALAPDREDGTWCNGLAGTTLVDVYAYRASGDARWRERARRSAALVVQRAGDLPDLCCGAAGGAYVLHALDGIDPARGWRDHALDLALRSITSERESEWPLALFRGDAGLCCLAVDLLSGEPAPFPCLDG